MYKTIVLALDGSGPSDKALAAASPLAKLTGSHIVAVHVVEHVAAGPSNAPPAHSDEQDLRAKIEAQIASLKGSGIDASLRVENVILGGPAKAIADVARELHADLIVTGTRGHSAVAGLIIGSVAQRLLHLAPCPVLVVPAHD